MMDPIRRKPVDGTVRQPELGVGSGERLILGDRARAGKRHKSGMSVRSKWGTPPRTSIYRISLIQRPLGHPPHIAHIGAPRTSRRRSCPRIADSAPAALPTQPPSAPIHHRARTLSRLPSSPSINASTRPPAWAVLSIKSTNRCCPSNIALAALRVSASNCSSPALLKICIPRKPGRAFWSSEVRAVPAGGFTDLHPHGRKGTRQHLLGQPELVIHRAGLHRQRPRLPESDPACGPPPLQAPHGG